MSKKNFKILLSLSFLTLMSGFHKLFEGMDRINPFLFYSYYNSYGDKGIKPSLFVYEISYTVEIFILLFILRKIVISKITKNLITPFIVISFLDIIDYVCFYKQMSFYKIPILIILVVIYASKWKILNKK